MNANEVLKNINDMLADETAKSWRIADVCGELGIFDWWVDNLSRGRLNEMRRILNTAIALGYNGYVCFKVGAKYCSHGMWAHKTPSFDGYSPADDGCLFHSFRPGECCWALRFDDGNWLMDDNGCIKDLPHIHDVTSAIVAHNMEVRA